MSITEETPRRSDIEQGLWEIRTWVNPMTRHLLTERKRDETESLLMVVPAMAGLFSIPIVSELTRAAHRALGTAADSSFWSSPGIFISFVVAAIFTFVGAKITLTRPSIGHPIFFVSMGLIGAFMGWSSYSMQISSTL